MNLALAFLLFVPARDDDSAALARVLEKLHERVARSVVAIEVQRESDPEGTGGAGAVAAHRDYYNRPHGPASGVVYEADGFIVTSYFNVAGVLKKHTLRVTLHDGRELPAELLGFDEQRDVALLKVADPGLPVLPKADAKAVGQGTLVALVGRSPDKRAPTINLGILSATNRMRNTAVQTDAEMNYGNAGGALVTLKGELVGVGCQVKPRTSWGQSGGIGFACKAAEIDKVLDRLKKGEQIRAEKRPFIGFRPGEGDPKVEGVQIGEVLPASPAQKAGLKKDDVIVEFDGKKVPDFEALRYLLLDKKIGDEVVVKVKRLNDKKEYDDKDFKLKLEGAPEEQ